MARAAAVKATQVAKATSKASPKASVKQVKVEKPTFQMTNEQGRIVEHLKGPSTRIRFLLSEGLDRSQITQVIPNAKGEKLLYQHVRNVEKQGMSALKKKEHEALVQAAMKLAGIKVRKDHK